MKGGISRTERYMLTQGKFFMGEWEAGWGLSSESSVEPPDGGQRPGGCNGVLLDRSSQAWGATEGVKTGGWGQISKGPE